MRHYLSLITVAVLHVSAKWRTVHHLTKGKSRMFELISGNSVIKNEAKGGDLKKISVFSHKLNRSTVGAITMKDYGLSTALSSKQYNFLF